MNKIIEKMNSKKEYAAPQMEVVDHVVQGFLCGSGEGEVYDCTGEPECAD
jgi:hypothetical protein